MSKHPQRRRPAHGVRAEGDQCPIVFVTVCTKQRAPILANEPMHSLLTEVWRDATAWLVGRYVLMPDHAHFFAGWNDESISLDDWVRYWKSQLKRRQKTGGDALTISWQTDHWDTRLRSEASYDAKWEYVRNNPVRKGLVAVADDWAYQGTLHELRWE